MRIATDVWVGALIRRAALEGAMAVVVRRGDAQAGAVLVKALHRREGDVRLYAQALDGEGRPIWIEPRAGAREPELDAYAERQAGFDPDIWLVEIDDAHGRHFLTEPVTGNSPSP